MIAMGFGNMKTSLLHRRYNWLIVLLLCMKKSLGDMAVLS